MELFFILPVLAGLAIMEFFFSDGGDSTADDTPAAPPPTVETPPQEVSSIVKEGTSGADTIKGASEDDFLLGGANADKIEGGAGDDLLLGENGADAIFGGIGYDTILGGAGNDALQGIQGKDLIIGGLGDDSIFGGQGDDTLVGSSGSDTLLGGKGEDLISGLDAGTSLNPLSINLMLPEAAAIAEATAIGNAVQTAFDDDINADLLLRLSDALGSGDSNAADDLIYGGQGDDTLMGDNNDTLVGEDGADVFMSVLSGAGEAVVIQDFNNAVDTLSVTVLESGAAPTLTFVDGATPADGVSVLVNGDVVAILKGLTAAGITSDRVTINVIG